MQIRIRLLFSRLTWVFVILVFLQGCSNHPEASRYKQEFQGDGPNKIFITNHGWHTGLIIPASHLYKKIPALHARFGKTPYLEIGWGDQGFYQAEEITAGLAVQAITLPTDTVLHIVAVPAKPQIYFSRSQMHALCLNDSEMDALLEFLSNSFHYENKKIVSLQEGIYGNSQFYKGSGTYYLTNTCNKWTAKAFKSIGMDITPIFYFRAESIMNYLKKHPKILHDLKASCGKQD